MRRGAQPVRLALLFALLLVVIAGQPGSSALLPGRTGRHVGDAYVSVETPTSRAGAMDDALWGALVARPLRLPTLVAGGTCPRASLASIDPQIGPAAGDGPVYAAGLGPHSPDGPPAGAGALMAGALVAMGSPAASTAAGGTWQFVKVLWVARPDYRAPSVIRGRRLDGPHELRFGQGDDPSPVLYFPRHTGVSGPDAGGGWRYLPSVTRLRAPGCYAYQVDGAEFTETIVFEATL